jgi:hypothetical protein
MNFAFSAQLVIVVIDSEMCLVKSSTGTITAFDSACQVSKQEVSSRRRLIMSLS